MSEFKDCPRCGRNHRHLKYCGWDVGKLKDHTATLERQLKAKEQEIKQFILLEIEELKNIRNRTEVNGKAMNRCNKRIKELEQELKEKSDE